MKESNGWKKIVDYELFKNEIYLVVSEVRRDNNEKGTSELLFHEVEAKRYGPKGFSNGTHRISEYEYIVDRPVLIRDMPKLPCGFKDIEGVR